MYFKSFLFIYAIFLIIHLFSDFKYDILSLSALAGGFAIAILSHRKHGYLPIIFIIIHIILEWYMHSKHFITYSYKEILFHGTYSVLDFIFLYNESKHHFKKYANLLISTLLICISTIFIIFYEKHPYIEHSHDNNLLKIFILSSILFCVIMQIKSKRAHKD